jgi:cell division protein FtsN
MMSKFSPKLPFIIFIIGFLLFSVPAHAGEHNWVCAGVAGSELWFVDTDSITCRENTCRTWVKMLPRASAKKLLMEGEGYMEALLDYNCTWLEYRILQTKRYDLDGQVVSSVSPTEPGMKHAVPEPISRQLHDLICEKINYQKEQQNTKEKYPLKIAEKEKKSIKKKSEKEKLVSPQPSKPPKAVFTIQVGAFENTSYAKSLKTMLKKKGYSAYITPTKKEGKLYKVCVGKFSKREEAKALLEKIKQTEGLQAFVTSW